MKIPRYSIKDLIAFTVSVAVLAVVVSRYSRPSEYEQTVAQLQHNFGAIASYSDERIIGLCFNQRKYFAAIDGRTASLSDADLKHVGLISTLERLDFSETNITDCGLRYLLTLDDLRAIDLSGTSVTIDGLEILLSQLESLRHIYLRGTTITSSQIRDCKELNSGCIVRIDAEMNPDDQW